MIDIILDAFLDSVKILPFLFLAYLLIEYIEHKSSHKLIDNLSKLGGFGAIPGALLGCVPQCGFSAAASNLYAGRLITVGTLIAIFISTSDEAIPVLLANPKHYKTILLLLLIKVLIAVIAGLLIDFILKITGKRKSLSDKPYVEICHNCGCNDHKIFLPAVKHTVNVFIFILVFNLILGGLIEFVGEDTISKVLMNDSVFQPLISGLLGFIPNCASSVILTQLYISGTISFGSIISGLITGAGIGLVILFKANKNLKENILIVLTLYVIGSISGIIIQLLS